MLKLSAHERSALPERLFAYPAQREKPQKNDSHLRNAITRFNQVHGVSDGERDEA